MLQKVFHICCGLKVKFFFSDLDPLRPPPLAAGVLGKMYTLLKKHFVRPKYLDIYVQNIVDFWAKISLNYAWQGVEKSLLSANEPNMVRSTKCQPA